MRTKFVIFYVTRTDINVKINVENIHIDNETSENKLQDIWHKWQAVIENNKNWITDLKKIATQNEVISDY